jgi:phosphate:Na+ symporter
MTGATVFLHFAGAVALLLWATRMVRTGVERAYGPALQGMLQRAFRTRPQAVVAGGLLAAALQSATAVALIVSSFVATGYVTAARGIVALLGADLGSALVARLLRLDLSLLIPALILAGTLAFRMSDARRTRQIGRIMVGIALLLLSLQMLAQASEPLRESQILPLILGYLSRDWFTAFVVAAIMAWLFHSSIAAVLLVAAMADQRLIPAELVVPLILGINFGATLVALYLGRSVAPQGRVVLLGNVALRGLGAAAALILHHFVALDAPLRDLPTGEAAVLAHIGFNAAVLLLGSLIAGPVAKLASSLSTSAAATSLDETQPATALNEDDLARPAQAVANAQRELIAMCGKVELMLDAVMEQFRRPRGSDLRLLARYDDQVDEIHMRIKLYLARIADEDLSDEEQQQVYNLMNASIQLEQIGDIVSRAMVVKIDKRAGAKMEFSEEGWKELRTIHDEVRRNARRAFNVLLSGDVEAARELVRNKETLRELVRDSTTAHLQRLRRGLDRSVATSSLHIDTLRDLKEVNSLLVALAYPVLEQQGMLKTTRLA